MESTNRELNEGPAVLSTESNPFEQITVNFRRDLAFPKLTEEMIQRLKPYGCEEAISANVTLYTLGDREIDKDDKRLQPQERLGPPALLLADGGYRSSEGNRTARLSLYRCLTSDAAVGA